MLIGVKGQSPLQGVGDGVPASRNKVPPLHRLTAQFKKADSKPKKRPRKAADQKTRNRIRNDPKQNT